METIILTLLVIGIVIGISIGFSTARLLLKELQAEGEKDIQRAVMIALKELDKNN